MFELGFELIADDAMDRRIRQIQLKVLCQPLLNRLVGGKALRGLQALLQLLEHRWGESGGLARSGFDLE